MSCETSAEITTAKNRLKDLEDELRYRVRQIIVYPFIRLKYFVIILIRRNFPRSIHFGGETCFLCIHWCVCGKQVKGKGAFLRWSGGVNDFFKFLAEECDHWLEDAQTLSEMEEQRSLKTVVRALREGKAVVIHMNGTGPVDVLGIYENVVEAVLFTNGDKETFILPKIEDQLSAHYPKE